MRRRILLLAALATPGLALIAAAPAAPKAAPKAGPVNAEGGLALAGHDPVAYFTESRATPGRADLTAAHDGATYRFASTANRDAFRANPEQYLPQYGGYCAFGLARGYKAAIEPAAFTIANGRLYLNYNAAIQDQWRRQQAADIGRADANWPKVRLSPDVAR